MYIKPLEEDVLEKFIPDKAVWTSAFGGNKSAYLDGCDKIFSCTNALYNLQKNLLSVLLSHKEENEKLISSRKLFTIKFREFVLKNCFERRMTSILHGNIITPTSPPVGLSFICVLLDVLKSIWTNDFEVDMPVSIEIQHFLDESFLYKNIDRVGGVMSYLRKIHRALLIERLGIDHEAFSEKYEDHLLQTEENNPYSSLFVIRGSASTGFSICLQPDSTCNQTTGTDINFSLPKMYTQDTKGFHQYLEIIDSIVILYYTVSHKYILKIGELRDNISSLSDLLTNKVSSVDANKDYETLKATVSNLSMLVSGNNSDNSSDMLHESEADDMKSTQNWQIKQSMLMARKQAWYRAVSLNKNKRNLLVWLLRWIINTIERSASEGQLFSFLPETYINATPLLLDTLLDLGFHEIQEQYNLQDIFNELKKLATIFVPLLNDSRIALSACKDAVIQVLGILACHKNGIQAYEQIDKNIQADLVRALLRPYENRAWGQSNWLLLRFWLGCGFANKESRPVNSSVKSLGLKRRKLKSSSNTGLLHVIAPAYPSVQYQILVAEILRENPTYTLKFLDSLLNQLDWVFSEFIQILQEMQSILNKKDFLHSNINLKQLKICAMCFELSVSLLRALEFIITLLPDLFSTLLPETAGDDLLNRICQILIQILTRTTIPISCFQIILEAHLPGLEHVTHFAIISVTLGLILVLMQNELANDDVMVKIPKVSRILLTDPNFHIACLEFTLGENGVPESLQNLAKGNFNPNLGRSDDIKESESSLEAMELKCDNSTESRSNISIMNEIFDLRNYHSHINQNEVQQILDLIQILKLRQSLLSEITVFSEDSLCPICCARKNNVNFKPCNHQSCDHCIIHHLKNDKLCFYCKTFVKKVISSDGKEIFQTSEAVPKPGCSSSSVQIE